MNLGEMRTVVRMLVNEKTPGFYTNPELNQYLLLASQRVNSIISNIRQEYFTVSATFQTIARSVPPDSYAFPSDLVGIRRMEIVDTDGSVSKLDELKFPRTESGGEWPFAAPGIPSRYLVRGKQFDLWPISDAIRTVRLYYTQMPLDLSIDASTPTAPVDFHDMIIFYACVLAKKQNEEDDAGFMGLFKDRKAELIETLISRGGDDGKFVEGYLEGM